MTNKYYSLRNLALSGREYEVLESYNDGRKKIKFPTFGGITVIAYPNELDGTFKERVEQKWQEEKERIAKVHSW